VTHDWARPIVPGKRLIKLLKNQNPRGGCSSLDLNIFGRRKVNVATRFEPMFPFVDQDAGFAINDIDEKLVVAGVAVALPIAFECDENLGKARTHCRRDEDVANGLLPTRQMAVNESAGCQKSVAPADNIPSESK